MRVLFFGTYERGYPRNAQVVTALRRAGVDVDERTLRSGTARDNWRAGRARAARLAAASSSCCAGRPTLRRACSSATPATSTCPRPDARRAVAPVVFNPLVSLADTLVDGPTPVPARIAAARLARVDRPSRAARRRPRRRRHARERRPLRRARRAPRTCRRGLPVGAEERLFHRRRGSRRSSPLFVGKLIPLHGLTTILAAAALAPELRSRRRQRPAREELSHAPAERRVAPVAPVRRAAAPPTVAQLRARGLRHVAEGGARDPEQGLPGARMRHAGGHRGHARRARAPRRRGERRARPAGRPGGARRRPATPRRRRALARRIGGGGLRAYRQHASEEVLGRRWRGLLERAAADGARWAPAVADAAPPRRRPRSPPGLPRSPFSGTARSRPAASTSGT